MLRFLKTILGGIVTMAILVLFVLVGALVWIAGAALGLIALGAVACLLIGALIVEAWQHFREADHKRSAPEPKDGPCGFVDEERLQRRKKALNQ